MHSPQSSLAARGFTGPGLKHILCTVFVFARWRRRRSGEWRQRLGCTEESEAWHSLTRRRRRAKQSPNGNLDRARGVQSSQHGSVHSGRMRVCMAIVGRDESVEGRDVRVERAPALVAGIYLKRKRNGDEGWNWRADLWQPRPLRTGSQWKRRAGHEPLEVSEVFQVEATLLLNIGFSTGSMMLRSGRILSAMRRTSCGQEVTRSRVYWHM